MSRNKITVRVLIAGVVAALWVAGVVGAPWCLYTSVLSTMGG